MQPLLNLVFKNRFGRGGEPSSVDDQERSFAFAQSGLQESVESPAGFKDRKTVKVQVILNGEIPLAQASQQHAVDDVAAAFDVFRGAVPVKSLAVSDQSFELPQNFFFSVPAAGCRYGRRRHFGDVVTVYGIHIGHGLAKQFPLILRLVLCPNGRCRRREPGRDIPFGRQLRQELFKLRKGPAAGLFFRGSDHKFLPIHGKRFRSSDAYGKDNPLIACGTGRGNASLAAARRGMVIG